ncbi:hypothetical protein [Pseudonocardia sp. ICBG1293]|uniref:hypothetical protein n=1 Tax=Pseudonocardia sp. ICBG1293 TaxID=2844382 RepID=UPI001CCA0F1B|nr:hypothetical protein [Pseudonocardia sp. ICBG1293]
MINYLSFPTTEHPVNGLRWDTASSSYRCPTCTNEPRTLMFGPVEAFVCGACASYWLTPTTGRRDLEVIEDSYRAAGCLDSNLVGSARDDAADGAVSAPVWAA